MTTAWIETPRGAFRYDLAGQGEGPPLVLLHEMGGSMESWDAVWADLTAQRRVLRYDVRGFGQSIKLTGPLAMQDWLDDLAGLLDTLDLTGPIDLAGIALNGATALAFAAAHPDRVRRVLASSPATAIPAERQAGVRDLADRMEAEGMLPLAESLFHNYTEPMRQRDPAAFTAFRARWICNDPRSFADTYRMLADLDMEDALRSIAVPTRIIGGTHDPLRPPETTRAICDMIPDAEYRELETGHYFPVQTPALCRDTLLEWFAL